MPRLHLINPAVTTYGFGIITPRWLYVLAGATPSGTFDELIITDEAVRRFRPENIRPGDVIGIGITTGNCARGYQIMTEAAKRGAVVVAGGIHATIFPDEPLEYGAASVVTGNADVIWKIVISDALSGKLKKRYSGGRVPGPELLSAKWELMNPDEYFTPAVQTIAGCPENCNFCSVWVTDGRDLRPRKPEDIISEVNYLYSLGYRYLFFVDDNFNPATLGRIAREKNPAKKENLIKIREYRLSFFRQYDKEVPPDIYGFAQMTSELASDPEYLDAMYLRMRIRGGLVGIESNTAEGLRTANKSWNPVGEEITSSLDIIQDRGIVVLSSLINGLKNDSIETIGRMRDFITRSGSDMAQFVIYSPYPGTVDYLRALKEGDRSVITLDKFWLDPAKPAVLFEHPSLSGETLVAEVKKSWSTFYSLSATLRRSASKKGWTFQEKLWFFLASLAFRFYYAKDGISSDSARSRKSTWHSALLMKYGISAFNWWLSKRKLLRPA